MKDELKYNGNDDLPGFLKDAKDRNPYKLPPQYFASLQDRVMDQVIISEKTTTDVSIWQSFWVWIRNEFYPKYALVTAAIAILLAVGIGISDDARNTGDIENVLAEFSTEQLEYMINDDLDQWDQESLISALAINDEVRFIPTTAVDLPEEIMEDMIIELDDETLRNLDNQ